MVFSRCGWGTLMEAFEAERGTQRCFWVKGRVAGGAAMRAWVETVVAAGALTGAPAGPEFVGHDDTARQIMMISDGARLLSASLDHTLRVRNVSSEGLIVQFDGAPHELAAVAIHRSTQWAPRARLRAWHSVLMGPRS